MNQSTNDWVGLEIAGGRYRIEEQIGAGSMGIVYRAHDHHLDINPATNLIRDTKDLVVYGGTPIVTG